MTRGPFTGPDASGARTRVAALLLAAWIWLLLLPTAAAAQEEEEEPPLPYSKLIQAIRVHMPQDTLGEGARALAMQAYEAGRFDEATEKLQEFVRLYPRNLALNEALETILLIRGNREFKDEPLRIYAAADAARRAGRPDSAAALARAGLSRYPGARIRDHWNFLLAQLARERGEHDAAIGFALSVADTTVHSRLAPYALKLAAEEALALGTEPARALRYYQDLLERYPDSPLAPETRARALELRKKLQL
jgi:TolA-binding protein